MTAPPPPACHEVHPGVACDRTAPGGYCAPRRCYCGSCPWWQPRELMPTYTPDRHTQFDRAAVRKAQRRAPIGEYRAEQAAKGRPR